MNRFYLDLIAICLICFSTLVSAACDDIDNEIRSGNSCTKIKTYKSTELTDEPILVIVLHGDSPFKKPGYQYEFAKKVALKNTNVVTIGMLRPGYTDPLNRTSDGEKGEAIGDNYDKKRVDQIAQAIIQLKETYSPSKVILAVVLNPLSKVVLTNTLLEEREITSQDPKSPLDFNKCIA